MNGYKFVKNEVIVKGVVDMIIMDVKIHNLYAFKNFHMNMSYPKKGRFYNQRRIFGIKT